MRSPTIKSADAISASYSFSMSAMSTNFVDFESFSKTCYA
jgi:hypothetical protein